MESTIRHFSHEHILMLTYLVDGVRCGICNLLSAPQPPPIGYFCKVSLYVIHKECAELPRQLVNHSLHALHDLTLAKRPFSETTTSSSCCYYCEKPFEDGYTYACDECSDFHMHIRCATIPLPTIISAADGDEHKNIVQFACHQNPMILVGHDDAWKRRAKCLACHSFWSAPTYSCMLRNCKNFIHKSCANMQQKIKHPFHPHHPLILQVSKPQSCHSCCKRNCMLLFSCHEDACNFNLCPECVFLDPSVKCQSHDHLLSLVKNASCEIQCDGCQKSYGNWVNGVPNEVNQTQSFLFRCMECDFNLHFLCGPLPSAIKYEYHRHPLILLDHSLIEDDSDEYYCDVCEEKMDTQFRIYYCADCKYAAHIHCLISKIMKIINEDIKDVELKALGEARWSQFGTEGTAGELTLQDIMDRIIDPTEKAMLIEPLSFNNPEENPLLRRNLYNYLRQFNFRLDVEGSIEDIIRIQRFFHNLGRENFENFCWELIFFTPDEGLRIDDKYLRQKVENVDGYMVPMTLAPIWKTFARKHGYRNMKENLTPQMNSITATLFCIVTDRMYKTKVEEVAWNDLKYWFFYLHSITCIRGTQINLTQINLSPFSGSFSVLLHAFLGLEAIRRTENGIRRLVLRIAELEAELEKCERLLDSRKTYDRSLASPFIQDCFRAASRLRQKDVGAFLLQM